MKNIVEVFKKTMIEQFHFSVFIQGKLKTLIWKDMCTFMFIP